LLNGNRAMPPATWSTAQTLRSTESGSKIDVTQRLTLRKLNPDPPISTEMDAARTPSGFS